MRIYVSVSLPTTASVAIAVGARVSFVSERIGGLELVLDVADRRAHAIIH